MNQRSLSDLDIEALQDEVDAHDRRIGENAERMAKLLNRIATLEDENEELRERLKDLEARTDGGGPPEQKAYGEMTRDDKTQKIRLALVRKASDAHGKAAMKYRDIKALFDERPSAGHTYDLMKAAGANDGFEYDNSEDTENRILVDLDDVNDEAFVRAAKNAQDEQRGSA